jgi:protein DGCR14
VFLCAVLQRKQVLEEEVYADAIEAIVERDFFPHLPKLQNQLEWLQAVQSGDPASIKRAQLNIARRRAGLRTPVHGSAAQHASAITPGTTGLLRTPAMTPAVGATPAAGRTPAGAAAAAALQEQGMDPVSAQQQAGARAPALGLDQFFSAYEGEDNASFQVLHEQTLARKRAKVTHHLEDKNRPLLLEAGGHSTDEYGTSGQAPSTVLTTKHTPKNALYYDSSQQRQLALSAAEKATIVAGPPKAINHVGTRALHEDDADAASSDGQQRGSSKAAAAALAPGTRGYGYMRTPQIVPGVDASPLMTWGDIASTPLRLDAAGQPDSSLADLQAFDLGFEELDEAEAAAAAAGKAFTLPEVRSRETAAQQLMAKKAASYRRGKQPSGTSAQRGSSTPLLDSLRRATGLATPGGGRSSRGATPGGSTPGGLSAAGLKLAQQLKRPGTGQRGGGVGGSSSGGRSGGVSSGSAAPALVGGDLALRASYQRQRGTPSRLPTGQQARPSGWEATPGRTGGSSSSRGVVGGGSSVGAQQGSSGKAAATKQSVGGGNITDDLLKL